MDDPRLQRLIDAVLVVAGDLELERVLRRIVEAGCALVDARYGALGVLNASSGDAEERGDGLSAFIHHGIDEQTAERIGDLPAGHGVLGELIARPEPVRLENIAEHPSSYGFPPGHPPMRSFLGTPIRVGGEVFGNLYLTEKRDGQPFTEEDEALIVGLAAVAGAAIVNARLYDELTQRDAWRDATLELASGVLAGGSPQEVRELITRLASDLVDAEVGCLVARDDQETGGQRVSILAAHGGDLTQRVVEAGDTPVWGTIVDGAPRRARYGPVLGQACMWVPIQSDGEVVAALGVGRREPFTDREEGLLVGFAGQVNVAWAYDRAQTAIRRLSVIEERERIGRDLHDTVIQRLFATGLSLEASVRRLDDRPEVADRVLRAVQQIDMTVREIRSTIFALQSSPGHGHPAGVRTRLLGVVDELAPLLGMAPRLRFEGPLDTMVGASVAEDLVPVLREGLTNVAKHASASEVEIEVAAVGDQVVLRIIDDGVGMGSPRAAAGDGDGLGLGNLHARAAARGGRCAVRSRVDGRGTELVWEVPVG